jgi:hypothetical protein
MRPKTSDRTIGPSNQGAEERNRGDHDQALLTMDDCFSAGLLEQMGNSGPLEGLPFKLSVVDGFTPKDRVETLIVVQIAEVHAACMRYARQLALSDNLTQQDITERGFNRLTRTFATLVETFQRYRTGGDQKVTVQQVSVSDQGQAIVGNVTQAPSNTTLEKGADSSPMTIVGEPERTPTRVRRGRKDDSRSPA